MRPPLTLRRPGLRFALSRKAAARILAVSAAAALLLFLELGGPGVGPMLRSFLDGSVTSPYAVGVTLRVMAPILLTGLAAALAFRGGLFDVGQPGYMLVGALAAAVAGAAVPGPAPLALLVGLLAGVAVAMAWAAAMAWTALRTGVALVVVSLISVSLADGVVKLLATRVFQDPVVDDVIETRALPDGALLPMLYPESDLRADILVVLLVVGVAGWWAGHTAAGHRLRMFGRNPEFAALAGTPPDAYRRRLIMSGAGLCGLAGGLEVFGVYGHYIDGTLDGTASPAWMGITLAIMAPRWVLLVPLAFLLASMQSGFEATQRDLGVGGSLGMVIQALLLAVAALAGRTSGVGR